jgi:hypothetical protein
MYPKDPVWSRIRIRQDFSGSSHIEMLKNRIPYANWERFYLVGSVIQQPR